MPICITCSTPVKHLYTTYSKADDRSLGKGVRLTQCPRCKRFADKYVEHDYVVLFIDLVLIKPQVYRHLLFNRLGRPDGDKSDKLDPSILRLGTLLILFDVFLTWTRIEKAGSNPTSSTPSSLSSSSSGTPSRFLTDAPIITQYLFFLTLNVLATIAQHLTIRTLVRWLASRPGYRFSLTSTITTTSSSPLPPSSSGGSPEKAGLSSLHSTREAPAPAPSSPRPDLVGLPTEPTATATPTASAISTALLVSSCTKLFPILLVIWPTDSLSASTSDLNSPSSPSGSARTSFASRARSYVGYAVLLNNIEALLILLDCGYVVATGLAVAGWTARWVVEGVLLGMVGLEGDAGPVGDLMGLVGRAGKWVGGAGGGG